MSTQVTLFKNQHGNVNVALRSGVTIPFIDGKFFTRDQELEAELMAAAKKGEYGIFIDHKEPEIDPEFATPMDQLKKKLRDEILAEMAAGGKFTDAGVSQTTASQLQTAMTSTRDATAAGGAGELSGEALAITEGQTAPVTPALSKLESLKAGK